MSRYQDQIEKQQKEIRQAQMRQNIEESILMRDKMAIERANDVMVKEAALNKLMP